MLKKIFLSLTVLFSVNAHSKIEKLTINSDIFDCKGQLTTLFEPESQAALYPASNVVLSFLGQSYLEKLNIFLADLKKINPSRANFIFELAVANENLQFKSGIKIQRSSPSSNLILPEGCTVDIIAGTSFNRQGYQITVDQDKYLKLSDDSKILFWFNLALDIEQTTFALSLVDYRYHEVEIDLILGRNFMACWLSPNCKPQSIGEMHSLALNKDYLLPTIEQDGIVIPVKRNKINFSLDSGLVKSALKVAENFYGAPSASFDSHVNLKGKNYKIRQSYSNEYFVSFNSQGKVHCATIENVEDIFNNRAILWEPSESGSYPLQFPTCWDNEENIIQGELRLQPQELMTLNVAGSNLQLNHFDRLAGNRYYAISFIFHKNLAIKWILRARGTVRFNNQNVLIRGPLKLHQSGDVACMEFAQKTSLRLFDGSRLEIKEEDAGNYLYCFNEKGQFENKYLYYDALKYIEKDLVSF